MKKLVIILAIVVTVLAINKEEKIVIPKEAIRFRVIANSNEEQDQTLKKKVVDNLNGEIRKLTVLDNTLENSRKNIKNKIPEFSQVVKETLDKNQSKQSFTIDYGMNYFPEKEYEGVKIPSGEYESLVITLGSGKGENWWCVMFPPLCLLEAKDNNTENIEYQRNYLVFVFKETYQGYDYSTHQDVEKTRYMYYYTNFDSSYDSDDEYMGESRLYNDSFDYVENEADVLTSLQKQSIADYGNSKVEEVTIPVS